MDRDIRNLLNQKGRLTKCQFGKSELDYFCSLAFEDSDNNLLCGAMVSWSKSIEVEGLEECFLTAKYRDKLKMVNKRHKKKGAETP